MAQAKVLTVVAGAIFDVLVDCRKGSATYGEHCCLTLTAESPKTVFAPEGFCHGFMTLQPSTVVLYKVSNYYSPSHEIGIRWNDPTLAVPWPLNGKDPIVSPRDAQLPLLADFIPL